MASRSALRRQVSRRPVSFPQPTIVEPLEDRTLLSVITFAVNSTADTVDANPGDGIAADASGGTSLRAAIMEANALNNADGTRIKLPAGNYGLAIAGIGEDNAATGDLDIKTKVTVTGASALTTSINGNSLDRVFHVLPGASLNLQKVRVSGGSTTDADPLGGGGVASDHATLNITDSIVSANQAAGHTEDFGGGGISVRGGVAVVNRSIIRENSLIKNAPTEHSSSRFGAGLYALAANVKVLNSTINSNTGHEGAGIANIGGGTMQLSFANVFDNTSDYEGGGIQNELSTLVINNSRIADNVAQNTGGGLYNFAGTVTMKGVEVINNDSSGNGGGIWNSGRATAAIGKLTILSSIIRDNSANVGGGVGNNRDSLLTIRDTTVSNNTATLHGGGIANVNTESYAPGTVSLLRTIVSGNTAGEYGGGLFAIKNKTNLAASIIRENHASEGGGLANLDAGVMKLSSTLVEHNSAVKEGGGITNEMASLTLANAIINLNTSAGDGGGLYNFAGVVSMTDGAFTSNSATSEGGGVENTGRATAAIGTMTIVRTGFTGNSAQVGGAIDNKRDSQMTINDSYIHDNHAFANGGGLANQNTESFEPGLLVVNRSTIANNSTDGSGGGIFTLKNKTNLRNSTVTENDAAYNGGGLASHGTGRYSVINSTIARNSANIGGGIYNSPIGAFSTANSIIALNTATTANPDAAGTFSSSTYNLVGILGSAVGFTDGINGNIVGSVAMPVDPGLGTLQNNGGWTPTLALVAGSRAIDAGSNAITGSSGLTTDQRGKPRIQDGDRNSTSIVDIGAYELQAVDALFAGSLLSGLLES